MIYCIIIDIQKEAIETLESYIKNRKELTLLKVFNNPTAAYDFLSSTYVDLVFTDVEMSEMNGLEIIEALRFIKGNNSPKFIITSDLDKYALSGFEQGAIDYLMKPVTFKRFCTSVDRFMLTFNSDNYSNKKDYFFI